MSDEEIITELTKIKGIGRWTAEMILIFRLARPDILPVGDLGIVKAIQKAYGLRKTPRRETDAENRGAVAPYRSVASWYLWASLENKAMKVKYGRRFFVFVCCLRSSDAGARRRRATSPSSTSRSTRCRTGSR